MFSARRALIVLTLASLAGAVQHFCYWPLLPEKVATHFGIDGKPNDWMSRASATTVFLSAQIGVPVFLVLVVGVARKLPNSLINVPHKDYWLAEERREESLRYMTQLMAWMAVLTSVFMAFIGHLTFLANSRAASLNLKATMFGMATYLTAIFVMIGFMLRRFRRPAP